jgi:hypothetical protein
MGRTLRALRLRLEAKKSINIKLSRSRAGLRFVTIIEKVTKNKKSS